VEAQLFYSIVIVLPEADGAGSHPDRPGIGKIKKYAKIKRFTCRRLVFQGLDSLRGNPLTAGPAG